MYPDWFAGWVEAEKVARALWFWAPLLVPGMFQTEAYARAILAADPERGEDPEELEALVQGRLERQQVLLRPRSPVLTVIVDEAVLHRGIGGPKVMHDQLVHLAEASERPRIYVHVVPSGVFKPFRSQQLSIALPSKNQALQLHRLLVSSG